MKPIVVYSRMWRSGTGLYAQGLARGIAEAGYDVVFIAPPGGPADPARTMANLKRATPPREHTEVETASRLRRQSRSFSRVGQGLGALLFKRLSCRRFVVTIPEPLLFWLPILMLLRASGAEVAFVCHDPKPHAWRLPPLLRSVERWAHAASYRWASKLVVLSGAGKAALVSQFDIDTRKIVVVPHGAFDQPWVGPMPGNRRLLVFGTIRRNKQVHVAMQAAAMVTGVRLTVAGGADENDADYLYECRQLASTLNGSVHLEIGYMTDERVTALLEECDALVLPYNDFDSQSGVAVLAGMAGRPVIAANAGGIPDLITAGLAAVSVAPPDGVEEVKAAIETFLATTPAEWDDQAQLGRRRLSEALSWARVGAQFGDIFK